MAAGYVIYGSSTMLVYTTGQGAHGFTLDPSIGEFLLSHPDIKIPPTGSLPLGERCVRAALGPRVRSLMRQYRGLEGDRKPLNVRYVGSLVADFHRNLLGGGVFAYPANTKRRKGQAAAAVRGEPAGVHRRAGRWFGHRRATRILDIAPTELHQRTPLYIGSKRSRDVASSLYVDAQSRAR